jgi:hypothetical protein
MNIQQKPRLYRQRSSFGYGARTNEQGQELLAQNALRSGVIVLPSGVQIELADIPGEHADEFREQHLTTLKDRSQMYRIAWKVKVFHQQISKAENTQAEHAFVDEEIWTLREVPRGIRDALLTGWFVTGTRWKVWIPAELGSFKNKPNPDVTILIIEVLAIETSSNYIMQIFSGFMSAILFTVLSFLKTKLRARSNHRLILPEKDEKSKALLDEQSVNPIIKTLKIRFAVDLVDLGECAIKLRTDLKQGQWLVAHLDLYKDQQAIDINNDNQTLRIDPNDSVPDRYKFSSTVSSIEEDAAENYRIESSTPNGSLRLYFMSETSSLLLSRVTPDLNESYKCLGTVYDGVESIQAILNCDDGGYVSSVSLL